MSKKVYAEYGCTFDLRDFPFDQQTCTMNFSMASAKDTYIQLKTEEEDVMYQVCVRLCVLALVLVRTTQSPFKGDKMLLEFYMRKLWPEKGNLTTESGKSMVSINIHFRRELGNMVNTYFQVTGALTFYALKARDFY